MESSAPTRPHTDEPTGPTGPTGPTVELVEVGPRDGLQNESRTLPVETRVELITRLLDLGVRRLEAVSFVRPDRVPQMAGAEEVMAQVPRREDVTYVGLVLNARGAERAAQTACTEINLVVPVTDAFAVRNQGADTAALIEQARAATKVAREAEMSVSVTLPVSFGCPFSGEVPLDRVADVIDRVGDLGVDELAIADTIGVGVPSQVAALGALAVGDDRFAKLRFHFHNTRNTGYANAWAATQLDLATWGGRVALDASLGGYGGCPFAPAATGNIATEDLAYLLRRSGVATEGPAALDLDAAADTSRWLAERLGVPVPGLIARAGDFPGELSGGVG